MTSILWLRRDLRRHDHPALLAAATSATSDTSAATPATPATEVPDAEVLPVFVIDPALWDGAGDVRRAWLARTVQAAAESYDGALTLRVGAPRDVIPALAREVGADSVHVTRETTPAGTRRDAAVARLLARDGVRWVESGTPYAVGPGLVTKNDGTPYRVFTPFSRAWRDHGWPAPAGTPTALHLRAVDEAGRAQREAERLLGSAASGEAHLPDLPPAGEDAALERWRDFLDGALQDYATGRDRPDRDGTSGLSPYLKFGAIHPRTVLADLRGHSGKAVERFVNELAWREFYADVLWHRPDSAWADLTPQLREMQYDEPDEDLEVAAAVQAWREGRTGYPIVDAGMRQLLATGWMHNRVRMVTASFLTKDLHVRWQVGARWFLERLADGDIASNNHGWQWVAGTGTDASPYNRVFNPTTQGQRFDPDGDYVRRWVPELAHVPGGQVHEPWKVADAHDHGYPHPLVEHAEERRETLRRFDAARGR